MTEIKIKAPAKINLSLQVLNKRADGFHNINSLMCPIGIFDEIIICESNDFQFTCDLDLGIPNEENLVFRAAKKLIEKYNLDGKVKISLSKKIPAGGGLGGGSSDAANVITGLCKYYEIAPLESDLIDLAASLGSDIPFFIRNSSAIVGGRGEILDYIPFELPWQLIIVAPDFGISTALAYKQLNRGNDSNIQQVDYRQIIPQILETPELMKQYFRNDFVYPEMEYYDEIANVVNTLYDNGAIYSNMSGSGSCCFGLFQNMPNVEEIKSKLTKYSLFI